MQTELVEIHLDAGQLDAVRRILRRARVTNPDTTRVLAKKIATTMAAHAARIGAPGYATPERGLHDQLRALYWLVESRDPPVGQIRAQLRTL